MASSYRNITVRPDVEFLGGTLTRPVIVAMGWTVPHDVYFELRYPSKDYTAANVIQSAEDFAGILEGYFDIDGLEDLTWTQVETKSGQLQDALTFYVSSSSGNSDDNVTYPYSRIARGVDQAGFYDPDVFIPALRAKLDKIEQS